MAPPAKKRRTSAPLPNTSNTSLRSSSPAVRPMSAATIAATEKAAKLAAAVQHNISFGVLEKYKMGMKILLPDSIYGSITDVSCCLCFIVDCCCFY
jgi:hypothetical protein